MSVVVGCKPLVQELPVCVLQHVNDWCTITAEVQSWWKNFRYDRQALNRWPPTTASEGLLYLAAFRLNLTTFLPRCVGI